ncbi:trans-resveratrol di-O-methyltransferase-like protein [Carex littledalei]|uniref:Trans-resveratrol di-O-methyltransferase-like protein n=1 Tax=Carex littledalei TaxID=544730 RepID=A0A833R230_9POAL|nr:trans-resveratrol di-O-methyltransferase-like protein [Carex littledalei]
MELTSVLNQSLTYISSFVLRCAVDLDIAGRIQAYGRPMPLNELARSIPISREKDMMLGRLMALLVHKEVFAQDEAGYVLTPFSKFILTENSNMGAFVRFTTELAVTKHLCVMSEWFKNGDDGSSVFIMDNDGKKFFDIAREKPEIGNLFNEAMASHSKQKIGDLVTSYPHIFDGLNSLVDVGGGTGTAAKIIADAFPSLRCTVLDLPHVVEKALESNSINVVAGDMFEKIPSADAILLNNVLHDWHGEDCVRILKRCKEAIEPRKDGSKVIVVDIIQDFENNNPKATETGFLFDILMMTSHGTKERTKQEWHDLIIGAGYSGYTIYPTRLGIDCVMELYP